jgi:transposase
LDRAAFHRKKKLKELARRQGARVLFLPAHSPDLNPIEQARATMKRELAGILPGTDGLVSAMPQYFLRYTLLYNYWTELLCAIQFYGQVGN